MYYKKLAEEYIEEAKRLNSYINSIKNQYKLPIHVEDRHSYYRIKILYAMYLDLKHVGEYLICKYGSNE